MFLNQVLFPCTQENRLWPLFLISTKYLASHQTLIYSTIKLSKLKLMHCVTYFPLLVVSVFLKRKYSYTNITAVAQINIK